MKTNLSIRSTDDDNNPESLKSCIHQMKPVFCIHKTFGQIKTLTKVTIKNLCRPANLFSPHSLSDQQLTSRCSVTAYIDPSAVKKFSVTSESETIPSFR